MNELTDDIRKGASANAEHERTRKRTTAELPVFRDCSNLLYIVMRVMGGAPRKMTKAMDEAIGSASELVRSVAYANEVRGEERRAAINVALANANTLTTIATSLGHLGVLPRQTAKDFRRRAGRVVAQLIGWRESATRQGHKASPGPSKGGELLQDIPIGLPSFGGGGGGIL